MGQWAGPLPTGGCNVPLHWPALCSYIIFIFIILNINSDLEHDDGNDNTIELKTKVHLKVRNNREGPYYGLLLVESAY